MSEYINITNMHELANAIKERNAIERARLEFEKEMFEFNKQLNIDNTKANIDASQTLSEYADMIRNMNENLRLLSNNDIFIKQEIDSIKALLENKTE